LCPEEKAQFKLMAAKLYKARVVTDMDVSLLTLYAESWWRHVQASNEVRKSGITYITHTGVIRQNPAVTIASKTQDQMFRILIELGMTPSARNKVHVVEGEGGDALDALARKRQDILK
jgi:P27 family predicted phage terminase small subunit